MIPGDYYWQTIVPVMQEIDFRGDVREQLDQIPVIERRLIAAHLCITHVCERGFCDYFRFGFGTKTASIAIEAFEAMGLVELASTVTEADRRFCATTADCGGSLDRILSMSTTENELYELFDELDARFFGLTRSEGGGWAVIADSYAQLAGSAPAGIPPIPDLLTT